MIHLLDANVLVDANRDYYPISRIPEFWSWLAYQGAEGSIKIPLEVYEEIKDGKDELATWAKQPDVNSALLLDEEPDVQLVARVIDEGYAPDLTDTEVEKIGRDPFLVAYALIDPASRGIVTTEVSKPSRIRANRHLPDICSQFGVECIDTFALNRTLDFSTDWRRSGGQ